MTGGQPSGAKDAASTNLITMKIKRGKEALEFIKVYLKMHGVSPTYEVIAKALGLKSRSNAHRIVKRLIMDGFLEKEPHKFYSIRVVKKRVIPVDESVREILSL